MTPMSSGGNQQDLRFNATLQDNVSPQIDAIAQKMQKLGASKGEIKLFIRAYDEASKKTDEIHRKLKSLPADTHVRISTNAEQAKQKLDLLDQKLVQLEHRTVNVGVNIKDNADETIRGIKAKFAQMHAELSATWANSPMANMAKMQLPGIAGMGASTLGAMAGVGGVTLGAGGGVALAQKSLELNSNLEQSMVQLTSILKEQAQAQKEYTGIMKATLKTPYNFPDVLQSNIALQQSGVNPRGGINVMTAGELAAGTGTPLPSATQALANAATAGDYRMLRYMGLNIRNEDFGPGGRFSGMSPERGISQLIQKQFGGAMLAQSQTWQGYKSNIQDIVGTQFLQPAGQGMFEMARGKLGKVQDYFQSPQGIEKLGVAVDKTQNALSKLLAMFEKLKDYFTTHLEAPLSKIIPQLLRLGTVFADAFSKVSTTTLQGLAEAFVAIAKPLADLANKVPMLTQLFGAIKAFQMLGFSKTAQQLKELIPTTDGLGSSIKSLISLMPKLAIALTVKKFLDMKTATDSLNNSFQKFGKDGGDALDSLKSKLDMVAGTVDKSVSGMRGLAASWAGIAPDGMSAKQTADWSLKGAETTAMMENRGFGDESTARTLLQKAALSRNDHDISKAADTITKSINNVAESLDTDLNTAAKKLAEAFTVYATVLTKNGLNNAFGAQTAVQMENSLQEAGLTPSQLSGSTLLGPVRSARDVTRSILNMTKHPTQDLAQVISDQGLNPRNYFNLKAGFSDPSTKDLMNFYSSDAQEDARVRQGSILKRQYFGLANRGSIAAGGGAFSGLESLMPTDLDVRNRKEIKAVGGFGIDPNAIAGGAKGMFSEWARQATVVTAVQQALSNVANEITQVENKAKILSFTTAAVNRQFEDFQHTLASMQNNMARFSFTHIRPLEREMTRLSNSVSVYQHEAVVPVQRAQEDWNMVMTRTSNKLADVSYAMGKAQFGLSRYTSGLLEGEQAQLDQLHSMDLYMKRLELLKLQYSGIQADLTKTTFNEGFKSVVKPLAAFSFERMTQMAQLRQQRAQLEYDLGPGEGHYQMQKAARTQFQREEMPLAQRLAGIKENVKVVDDMTWANRRLEDVQYKQSLTSRKLTEQMYSAQVGARKFEDAQFGLSQQLFAANEQLQNQQDHMTALELGFVKGVKGTWAYQEALYLLGKQQYKVGLESETLTRSQAQLNNLLIQARTDQKTLGEYIRNHIDAADINKIKAMVTLLEQAGTLSHRQGDTLRKGLVDDTKKVFDASLSNAEKFSNEFKQTIEDTFSLELPNRVYSTIKDAVANVFGSGSTVGNIGGSLAGGIGAGVAGIAAINTARIAAYQGLSAPLSGAGMLLGGRAKPDPFGAEGDMIKGSLPGRALMGAGSWLRGSAPLRTLTHPLQFGATLPLSLALGTVGGAAFGPLGGLAGLLGGSMYEMGRPFIGGGLMRGALRAGGMYNPNSWLQNQGRIYKMEQAAGIEDSALARGARAIGIGESQQSIIQRSIEAWDKMGDRAKKVANYLDDFVGNRGGYGLLSTSMEKAANAFDKLSTYSYDKGAATLSDWLRAQRESAAAIDAQSKMFTLASGALGKTAGGFNKILKLLGKEEGYLNVGEIGATTAGRAGALARLGRAGGGLAGLGLTAGIGFLTTPGSIDRKIGGGLAGITPQGLAINALQAAAQGASSDRSDPLHNTYQNLSDKFGGWASDIAKQTQSLLGDDDSDLALRRNAGRQLRMLRSRLGGIANNQMGPIQPVAGMSQLAPAEQSDWNRTVKMRDLVRSQLHGGLGAALSEVGSDGGKAKKELETLAKAYQHHIDELRNLNNQRLDDLRAYNTRVKEYHKIELKGWKDLENGILTNNQNLVRKSFSELSKGTGISIDNMVKHVLPKLKDMKFDANHDGKLTGKEVIKAIRAGIKEEQKREKLSDTLKAALDFGKDNIWKPAKNLGKDLFGAGKDLWNKLTGNTDGEKGGQRVDQFKSIAKQFGDHFTDIIGLDTKFKQDMQKAETDHWVKIQEIRDSYFKEDSGNEGHHGDTVDKIIQQNNIQHHQTNYKGWKALNDQTKTWLGNITKQIQGFQSDMGLTTDPSGNVSANAHGGVRAAANGALIKGTPTNKGHLVRVGEEGFDEVIIPLAPHRRDRAIDLIRQTQARIGGLDPAVQNFAHGGFSHPKLADAAAKVLSGSVSFWSGLSTGSDRYQFERLKSGKPAHVPSPEGPHRYVWPSLAMIESLAKMSHTGSIMINALTGGDHSSTSPHYRGKAVDLDLTSGLGANKIISIASQFGGSRNWESSHYHLDFPNGGGAAGGAIDQVINPDLEAVPASIKKHGIMGRILYKALAKKRKAWTKQLESTLTDSSGAGGDTGGHVTGSFNVAKEIFKIWEQMHLPQKYLLAAYETALVESGMTNPAGGDGTSVGWRQETSSSYPNVDRMDVGGGARRFFQELKSTPQRGSIGRWAQAVQRSAYPDRYDQREADAAAWVKKMLNLSKTRSDFAHGGIASYANGGTVFDAVKSEADRIDSLGLPYVWGGGHAVPVPPNGTMGGFDCTGAMWRLLQTAGYPVQFGNMHSVGDPGKGRVSILTSGSHVYGVINDKAWGAMHKGSKVGWGPWPYKYRPGFQIKHIPESILGGGSSGGSSTHDSAANWRTVGASMFTDHGGYHGDNLYSAGPSYAELGMGHNLGHLPYKKKLWIKYRNKIVEALKLDIGAGGGSVKGHRRDIDLHETAARVLGFPNGIDLVQISTTGEGGSGQRVRGKKNPYGPEGVPKNLADVLQAQETSVVGKPGANRAHGGFEWAGWFAKGGDLLVNRPTIFGAGEAGPERVTISKHDPVEGSSRATKVLSDILERITGLVGSVATMKDVALARARQAVYDQIRDGGKRGSPAGFGDIRAVLSALRGRGAVAGTSSTYAGDMLTTETARANRITGSVVKKAARTGVKKANKTIGTLSRTFKAQLKRAKADKKITPKEKRGLSKLKERITEARRQRERARGVSKMTLGDIGRQVRNTTARLKPISSLMKQQQKRITALKKGGITTKEKKQIASLKKQITSEKKGSKEDRSDLNFYKGLQKNIEGKYMKDATKRGVSPLMQRAVIARGRAGTGARMLSDKDLDKYGRQIGDVFDASGAGSQSTRTRKGTPAEKAKEKAKELAAKKRAAEAKKKAEEAKKRNAATNNHLIHIAKNVATSNTGYKHETNRVVKAIKEDNEGSKSTKRMETLLTRIAKSVDKPPVVNIDVHNSITGQASARSTVSHSASRNR